MYKRQELKRLGIKRVRPLGGGVAFFCDVRHALSACLWSRLASRILVVVGLSLIHIFPRAVSCCQPGSSLLNRG